MAKEYLLKIYSQGQVQNLVVRQTIDSVEDSKVEGVGVTLTGDGQVKHLVVHQTIEDSEVQGERITLTGGGQVQHLVVVKTL